MKSKSEKVYRQFNLPPAFAVLLAFVFLVSGCDRPTSSTAPKPTPTPATQFERDLQYARNGQYKYVYVFARPDSAPFTTDDIAYLKANAPSETNMWLKTDEGRRVIAGSNFTFKPEHMEALTKRFAIDDQTGK